LPQLVLKFDGLLQAFESPFAFFFFQRSYGQKLGDSIFRFAQLELLRIVVLVFDVDIALVLVIVFLVFEVVP
jgi:hypothetical protein